MVRARFKGRAPEGSWRPWWVLGDSDHNSTGHKIDQELRREHPDVNISGDAVSKFLLRNSLRGDLALRYEYMQSFKPLFPAPHQGSSKAASQEWGWPARCRPHVRAWDDTLAGSFMPVSRLQGECCGRSPKGEPVSLCWGKQYPNAGFQYEKNQEHAIVWKHSRPVSHREEVDVLGGLGVPWLVFRRQPVGAWVCKLSDWTDGQAVIPT